MRLVSWNVAGRVRRLDQQAAAIADEAPELVALQQVSRTTLPRWRAAIADLAIVDDVSTWAWMPQHWPGRNR